MKNAICFALFFALIISKIVATDFGYLCYETDNIGDDIQAIAAKRFLPQNSIPINRDFIRDFHHGSKVCAIVNGWYMHKVLYLDENGNIRKSEYKWPPSQAIDPLLISMHFSQDFVPSALSEESIEYLKKHGPVGAGDYFTLGVLQSKNIPSYFSGCLTLTLTNTASQRDDVIYAVDLDEECVNFIRSKTKYPVQVITHEIKKELMKNQEERLKNAEEFIGKYQRARYVITTRLHAAMPCLALETPVLLINVQSDEYRFSGLKELVRNCSRQEFLSGTVDFDLNTPGQNPKLYLPVREALINRATSWVAKKKE